MKDYIVDVTMHVEVSEANEDEAREAVASLIAEAAIKGMMPSYTVAKPRCVGGDDDIASDLSQEVGVPYETALDFIRMFTKAQLEELTINELVEKLEAKI
jgi:hypothetical protein